MPKEMTTAERVREQIAWELDVDSDDVTNEKHLVEHLGADSLDVIELAMALEEEFEIEIPDADAEKLMTVGEVIRYIEGKVGD